jgi:predicted HTH domain antitoxin
MSLTISDDLLAAAHISEEEALRELAITLFQQERLTLGQAARFAKIDIGSFMKILGSRRISLHYGVEEFEQDLRTVRELDGP